MEDIYDGIGVIISIPVILIFSYIAGILVRVLLFQENTIGSGFSENAKTTIVGFVTILILGFILTRLGCSSDDSMIFRQ
jgi:hypothetical protein